MRLKAIAFSLAVLLATEPAAADGCFNDAGHDFGISPVLLKAIALVESEDRLSAIGLNRNGSEDLCAMQVNSQHLPHLAAAGVGRDDLLSDRCTCVYTGAYILAREITTAGPTWLAVARYHTGPRGDLARGHAYAQKVKTRLEQLTARQRGPGRR